MCVSLIPNESIDPKSLQVTRDGARMPAARKITFKFRTKWRVFTLSIPLHPSRLSCKDLMTPFLSQSQQCPTLLPASIPTTSRGPPTPCVTHLSLPLRVQRLPQGAHALAAVTVHALPPCWYADMSISNSCCLNGTGVVDFDVPGLVLSMNARKGECQRRRGRLAGGRGGNGLGFRV